MPVSVSQPGVCFPLQIELETDALPTLTLGFIMPASGFLSNALFPSRIMVATEAPLTRTLCFSKAASECPMLFVSSQIKVASAVLYLDDVVFLGNHGAQ